MAIDIERILRLTADYHNFCLASQAQRESGDPDELTAEDLDLVAAAANIPRHEDEKQDKR